MNFLLVLPALLAQSPQAPLPVVEAKDLPMAPRGPMNPGGPDPGRERGILGQARTGARGGPSIPALQLPEGSVHVVDKVPDLSGRRAYAIQVPPGEGVSVHVVVGRKAYFTVSGMNSWGRLEVGLIQNVIYNGEPKATYKNPTQETKTIYFIVDTKDPNMVGEAFEVDVIRTKP